MKMKLYQFETCFFCRRVRDALEVKGIEYVKVEVPLERSERTELFDISGQYMVPVLVDGKEVINDSARIIAYLDEKY